MKTRLPSRIKQPTPAELTDSLLDFLKRKFYTEPGDDRKFAQDRSRLLAWVVLWPASWLNKKGVTIHGESYRQLFFKTFLEAAAHRSDRIQYRPAWLRMVIQSHWAIHGEEYYEEAKSVRNLTEHAIVLLGKQPQQAADPVRDLAAARSVLTARKSIIKRATRSQLELL